MSDDAFSVSLHQVETGVVLAVRGDLDAYTSPQLLEKIGGISLVRGQVLVVDLSGTRFCDSSGISAFVAARNLAATAHAGIVLAAVPRQILRVLGMVGLDSLFTISPSVQDALSAHRAGSG
ncbi:STAS domain-containing protein [Lentzea cavernae]|uniref:Anti-sigma factor antagonist n=1 Tax=Lentzea cavernae TaxID=2020703 RepID=A0ABQ3ME49_9PSEU|nr:STAS domain-containing protein [Lentzea cavernae]GHH39890.1 anti-sigma factor antagonist [Lentzea cavernae]